jgi:hypothetical protein
VSAHWRIEDGPIVAIETMKEKSFDSHLTNLSESIFIQLALNGLHNITYLQISFSVCVLMGERVAAAEEQCATGQELFERYCFC